MSAWENIPVFVQKAPQRVEEKTLRADGIEARIVKFFHNNPDEELTISDAVVKFGGRFDTVSVIMRGMYERGVLKRQRTGRFVHYSPTRYP